MQNVELLKAISAERRPVITTLVILADWAVILVALSFLRGASPWWVTALVFGVVAAEQHALGLWMHESAHWLLASKKTNDLISRIFLAGPLLVPLSIYRRRHFTHHGYLGTEQDTKRVIFTDIRGWRVMSYLVNTLVGLSLLRIAKGYISPDKQAQESGLALAWDRKALMEWAGVGVVHLILLVTFTWITGSWVTYFLFWLLPWLTFNRMLAGLRSMVEHQPLPGEQYPITRMLKPTLVDRFLFCRAGFDRHWTHHQYPNVPCFNLKHLDEEAPQGQRHGYLKTLLHIVHQKPAK